MSLLPVLTRARAANDERRLLCRSSRSVKSLLPAAHGRCRFIPLETLSEFERFRREAFAFLRTFGSHSNIPCHTSSSTSLFAATLTTASSWTSLELPRTWNYNLLVYHNRKTATTDGSSKYLDAILRGKETRIPYPNISSFRYEHFIP